MDKTSLGFKPLRLLAAILAITAPASLYAAAGSVQFVSGEAKVMLAGGGERTAVKGAELNEGDSVITGRNGSVQLRMADQGLIAIRPDSQLKIDTYRFAGLEDGSERGVLSLVRGGFRTLTGIIGRVNKRNYQVNTPNATIGIRGTDHEIVHIPVPGPGEVALGAPGTYNKVNVGETYMQTNGGRIDLGANQIGFAGAVPGAAPTRLDSIPPFLRATPQQQGRDDRRQAARESNQNDDRRINQQQQVAQNRGNERGDGPRVDDRRNGPAGLQGDKPALPQQTTNGGITFAAAGSALSEAPGGYSAVGGDKSGTQIGSGAIRVVPGTSAILFGQDGQLALIAEANGFRYARSDAKIVDSGVTTLNDAGSLIPVKWGVYAGGGIVDNQGARAADFFHYMSAQSTPTTVTASLNANYNTVFAQTKLITETGKLGGNVNSAGITIAGGQLTAYTIGVTDGLGRNWNGNCGACTAGISLAQFASNGVTITGTGAGNAATGKAQGIPIGPSAAGILSSFNMSNTIGNAVTGSFAAK